MKKSRKRIKKSLKKSNGWLDPAKFFQNAGMVAVAGSMVGILAAILCSAF